MAQHTQPGWYGSGNRSHDLDQDLEAATIAPADYPPQPLNYDQNMNPSNDWMGPPGGIGYTCPALALYTHPINVNLGNYPGATNLQDLRDPHSLFNATHVPGNTTSSNGLGFNTDRFMNPMSPVVDAINRLKATINQIQPPPDCRFDFYMTGLEKAVSVYAESQRKANAQNEQMASSFLTPPTSRSIASTIPYNSSGSNHDLSSTLTFNNAQLCNDESASDRIPETVGQVPSREDTITASRSPKRRLRRRGPESSGDSKSVSLSGPRPKRTRLPVISETGLDSQKTTFPCQSCKKAYPKLSYWHNHQSRVHFPPQVYVCLVCFEEKPSGLGPSTKCRKRDNFRSHQIRLHSHNNDNGKVTLKKEMKRCTIEITGVYHDTCGYCWERLPDGKTSRKHITQHMNDGETRTWKHQCEQNHEEAIRKCVAAHLGIPEFDEDDPRQSDDDEDDFEGDSEPPEGSDFQEDAAFAPSSGHGPEGGSFSGNGDGRSALDGFSVNGNSARGHHVHSCGEDKIADEIDMPLESKDIQSCDNALIPFQSLKAVRELGSGGFGTVQEVVCSDFNQTFAMKTIQRHRFGPSDAQETAAFKNEVRIMRALRALRSPHLVEFICSYTHEDRYSILMAPAAHIDLARYMRTAKTTPESQENLFRGVACLAATIKEIHSGSVVGRGAHHDLKPANILIDKDGTLILADFGLSKIDDGDSELTRTTKVTPEYAPPEVIEHGLQGRASDIWSLGCIFLEILTFCQGKNLYDFEKYRSTLTGDKSFHKTWEKTREWIDLLEEQDPMCCPGPTCSVLFDVIRQMISRNPKDRPTAYEIWLKLPKCTCPFDSRRSGNKAFSRALKEWLNSDRNWNGREKFGQCAKRFTTLSSPPEGTSSDRLSSTLPRRSEIQATTKPYVDPKNTSSTSTRAHREDSTVSDQTQSKGQKLLPAMIDKHLGGVPGTPQPLASVSNRASALQCQGKYEAAEKMKRQALEGKKKALGKEHHETLTSVSIPASVLQDQGNYETAEKMNRRALKGKKKVPGKGHPDTLVSIISNIALVWTNTRF